MEELRNKVKLAAQEYFRKMHASQKDFTYIPTSGKILDEEDLCAMIDASLDMWLTTGRFNDEFEKELADYLGSKHVLTTNSGSSANLLAISALTSNKLGDRQLKQGDEVITLAAGFPTTVNPIIQNGLVPVFVDCELETYNISIDDLERSISEKTKAIFIAHTLGNPFPVREIKALCQKHNLWLIEDSCDALGATYDDQKTGSIGDIGTFSFYPAHHITMGEGGAVSTNNPLLYKILLSYRDWGRDCWCPPGNDDTCQKRFNTKHGKMPLGYDHKYIYSHIGYNLKITDWQAAIALSQLKKLPGFIEKRTRNTNYLYSSLSDLKNWLILPKSHNSSQPSWFGFLLSVKPNDKFSKQEMVEFLEQNGIGTRQLFAGNILRQPMFTDNNIPLRIKNSDILHSNELDEKHYAMLPNTEFVMNNSFWLGIYPALEEKDLDRTSHYIHKFIEDKTK